MATINASRSQTTEINKSLHECFRADCIKKKKLKAKENDWSVSRVTSHVLDVRG